MDFIDVVGIQIALNYYKEYNCTLNKELRAIPVYSNFNFQEDSN